MMIAHFFTLIVLFTHLCPSVRDNTVSIVDLTINYRHKSQNNKIKERSLYFDLVYDVLPFLLSRPSRKEIDYLIVTKDSNCSPTDRFAIFCTPRAGSNYLCDLLKSNGMGRPLEHLRSPLLYIIEHRQRLNIDLELLFQRIVDKCSDNNFFGTKVIGHYLFDLLEILNEKEKTKLISILGSFKIIYLHRRDKIAQAVSKYLAIKSNFWQSNLPHRSLSEYKEQLKTIKYDFEAIAGIYENLIEEEKSLEEFVRNFDSERVIEVEYEELNKNPTLEIKRIADLLEYDFDTVNLDSEFEVLSSEHSLNTIDRFRKEYNRKQNRSNEQIDRL